MRITDTDENRGADVKDSFKPFDSPSDDETRYQTHGAGAPLRRTHVLRNNFEGANTSVIRGMG